MALTDRDRRLFAMQLQRAHPDVFEDITDAEDYVDAIVLRPTENYGNTPSSNFEEWVMQKMNMVGEPITVKDNHTIIFTDEMKQQILDKGLPRLRKGGLAQKKAPRQ